MKAEAIAHDFAKEVLAGFQKDIENDYIRNQNQHLESIIEPLKPKKGKQFLHSLLASMLGAFLLALLLAAFGFIKSNNQGDDCVKLSQEIEQFVENVLSKRDIPSTVEYTDQDGNVGEQQHQ